MQKEETSEWDDTSTDDKELYADYKLKEEEEEEEELEYGFHSCLPVLQVDKKQLSEYAKKSWENEPPSSAEEYLLRVRIECRKCDQTKIADNYEQIKQKFAITTAEKQKLSKEDKEGTEEPPTKKQKTEKDEHFQKWQNKCIEQFVQTRELVEQKLQQTPSKKIDLPGRKEWEKWKQLCFSSENDSSDAIFQMDMLQINSLFQRMVQWTVEDSILEKQRFIWLHGLLTVLDYPLIAENAACMNHLFQWAHGQRESLTEELQHFASHLNTLLVIINDFFKQGNSKLI